MWKSKEEGEAPCTELLDRLVSVLLTGHYQHVARTNPDEYIS